MSARRALGPYALVLPALVVLLVLGIVPLALIVYLSFQTPSPTALWQALWTIGNYKRVVADGFYLAVIGNSLRIGAITTLLCVAISYPIAYHLARAHGPRRALCLFFVFCPLLVSTVINSFGWVVVLGDKGVVNAVITAFGLPPQHLLYSEPAVIIALTHIFIPFMALPLMAAIERIPRRLEEAAQNLGCAPFTVFLLVILPLSLPGLAGGAIVTFTLAFSAVVTPMFLGGRQVQMIGPQIYESVLAAFNWPFAATLTTIVVTLSAVAVFTSGRLSSARGVRRRTAGGAGAGQ